MSRLNQYQSKNITPEEIMLKTNGGLDVFKNEISDFSITKNIKNPFVSKDKNPSARIKQSNSGLWLLNIYNDEGGYYNAITFIKKKYNLNFKQAIEYILNNQNLSSVIKEKTKVIKKNSIYYDVGICSYTKQHKDYYCIKEITAEFLENKMNIYAINSYAINKHVKEVLKDQYMFAYLFLNNEGELVPGKIKLLTLGKCDKKDKWKNNLNPFDFFYTYKLKSSTNICFVVKSNKDCCVFELCGYTAIASMSENKNNIIEGLKPLIKQFPNTQFIIALGSDEQGKKTSIEITKELNLSWFNIPNHLLNNSVNDFWEYYKNFGLNSFKQLLKNKGFL